MPSKERLKNIGGWLLTVAFEIGAGLMALKEAWLLVLVLALAGVGVQGFAHFPGRENRRKMVALSGMLIFGLMFLGCAAIYFWPLEPPVPVPHQAQRVSSEVSVRSPFDDTILIECGVAALPAVVPPEGVWWFLQLWPIRPENGGGGIAQMFGTPGGELKWPMYTPIDTTKCKITNYGKEPVFNVRLTLGLSFREVIRNAANSVQSGAEKFSRDWIVDITRIEPGSDHPFIFWVGNNSNDDFVHVVLPTHATLLPFGGQERVSVRLIRTERNDFFVNPMRHPT